MAKVFSGSKLRQAREALGLPKAELARRLTVRGGKPMAARYIYALETGENAPSVNLAAQLAAELGLAIEDLMDDRPDSPQASNAAG